MEPTLYMPFAREGADAGATLAIRTAAGSPESLAHSVAAAIEKEDPTAVLSFRTFDEQIAASLTQERLVATLAGFFGVLGLLLAAVGLYGVTSYAVTSRGAEIGIRMALGASARGVVGWCSAASRGWSAPASCSAPGCRCGRQRSSGRCSTVSTRAIP